MIWLCLPAFLLLVYVCCDEGWIDYRELNLTVTPAWDSALKDPCFEKNTLLMFSKNNISSLSVNKKLEMFCLLHKIIATTCSSGSQPYCDVIKGADNSPIIELKVLFSGAL